MGEGRIVYYIRGNCIIFLSFPLNLAIKTLNLNPFIRPTAEEDERFMLAAIKEAKEALRRDEVPIGAVIVCEGVVIAKCHNLTETLNDTTAHAEMQAITSASAYLNNKYLDTCTLYVTLEPCPMCAGAAFWSHIGRLVYGASDPKRGYSKNASGLLHPKTMVTKGIMDRECLTILQDYFKTKRMP
jgi:tRNA(adenine34) deaminase